MILIAAAMATPPLNSLYSLSSFFRPKSQHIGTGGTVFRKQGKMAAFHCLSSSSPALHRAASIAQRQTWCRGAFHLRKFLTVRPIQVSYSQRQYIWRYSSEGFAKANMSATVMAPEKESSLDWARKDNRRLLHVMYQVGDLERTIKFYTECLGMKLLRKRDNPEERYTNAFLGYGPEDSHFVVELTYHYGVDKYDIGPGFGHFGVAIEDVTKTVELIKLKGGLYLVILILQMEGRQW